MLVLHELQLVTIDGIEALLVEHVPVARARVQHHKRLLSHLRATRGYTELRVDAHQRQAWRVYRGVAQGRQHRPCVGDGKPCGEQALRAARPQGSDQNPYPHREHQEANQGDQITPRVQDQLIQQNKYRHHYHKDEQVDGPPAHSLTTFWYLFDLLEAKPAPSEQGTQDYQGGGRTEDRGAEGEDYELQGGAHDHGSWHQGHSVPDGGKVVVGKERVVPQLDSERGKAQGVERNGRDTNVEQKRLDEILEVHGQSLLDAFLETLRVCCSVCACYMRACDATSAEHSGAVILSVVADSPNDVELDFSHWTV